jgi:hypothetical protein
MHPPPLGIVTLSALLRNTLRGLRERRAFIARVRSRAAAARRASEQAAGKLSTKGGKPATGEPNQS